MKGLLLKDTYVTVKYCKNMLIFSLIFIAVSFIAKENILFMLLPLIVSGEIPCALLGLDEQFKWTKYSGALPYSAAQIVSAKYLFGPLYQAFTAVIVFIALIIRVNTIGDVTLLSGAQMIGGVFVISLILPALCLPCCFAFGNVKGRIANIIVMLGLMTVIWNFIPEGEIPDFTAFPVWIVFACAAVIYALSWLISISVYVRRNVKD